MNSKKFVRVFIGAFAFILIAIMAVVAVIDPYFHYHTPQDFLTYDMARDSQRYINNGITRNFEYDALITGTSMTENFMTSELDELFSCNSIKIPVSGSTFKETNELITNAISYNDDLKLVVRGLDISTFDFDKDSMGYSDYPTYLYDDDLLNDVNYLLNKNVLGRGLLKCVFIPTITGAENTDFDTYSNWNARRTFGADAILSWYNQPEKVDEIQVLSEETIQTTKENLEQNVIQVAIDNPDIEFYYFLTPYSILYFDTLNQKNELSSCFDLLEFSASLMLEVDNINLFYFDDMYEYITNLDYYKDTMHYSEDVNSVILECMADGVGLLCLDNYVSVLDESEEFYSNFDYSLVLGD